jgi:hypothetical protein
VDEEQVHHMFVIGCHHQYASVYCLWPDESNSFPFVVCECVSNQDELPKCLFSSCLHFLEPFVWNIVATLMKSLNDWMLNSTGQLICGFTSFLHVDVHGLMWYSTIVKLSAECWSIHTIMW